MAFCTDTDLLYWEPNLFSDAAAAAQTLVQGTASLDGTTATIGLGAVTLDGAGVKPLDVIVFFGDALSGAFPIVSVDTELSLTLSVLYDGLYPSDGSAGAPSHMGAGAVSDQAFAVRTFWPHRRIVTQMLLQAAGIDPAAADAEGSVVNAEALRRPCVLGTLQLIYSALAASAEHPANFTARADLYERLYRRSMRAVKVEIDTDGDGRGDVTRALGLLALVRG